MAGPMINSSGDPALASRSPHRGYGPRAGCPRSRAWQPFSSRTARTATELDARLRGHGNPG